jgi:hypothetical protein
MEKWKINQKKMKMRSKENKNAAGGMDNIF